VSSRARIWLCALVCFTVPPSAFADDWPFWRGPARNGITGEDSGWRSGDWKLREAWRRKFGEGSTSPIVHGGRLYTLGWKGERDHLSCVDAATGKDVWTTSYPSPRFGRVSTGDKGQYSGASATPEFDAATGFLYTLGVDGDLRCWDTREKGRSVWKLNLYDKYRAGQRPEVAAQGGTLRDYGYTSSPLVQSETLIVEVGCKEGTLVAFDKRTGKELWKSQCADEAGHSGGPVPMTVEGVPCAVILTIRSLLVARLDPGNEGKTVATFKWATDFANNIPTPAVHENFVVVTSAYNHMAVCKLRITLSGAEKVWETPKLASGVCSPVIHNGNVYWAWRRIYCLDFETGKEKWSGGNVGSAGSCLLTQDRRLIVWGGRGDLSLVESADGSPNRFKELAQRTEILPATPWPHVVLAEGRLYCRDRDGNVVCFEVGSRR
jgi:outer membrane protein assembly factor BamB